MTHTLPINWPCPAQVLKDIQYYEKEGLVPQPQPEWMIDIHVHLRIRSHFDPSMAVNHGRTYLLEEALKAVNHLEAVLEPSSHPGAASADRLAARQFLGRWKGEN